MINYDGQREVSKNVQHEEDKNRSLENPHRPLSYERLCSRLTPELTGREGLYQAFNLADGRQAIAAPVE